MSNYDIIEITKDIPGFDAYLERLVETCSLAFEYDPLDIAGLGASYKDDPKIHNMYGKAQLDVAFTGAGRVFGVFVGGIEPSKMAGFAVWYEPGKEIFGDDTQRSLWHEFSTHLKPELLTWWEDKMLPSFNRLIEESLGQETKKGILHLQLLGVHPDFQRRGLAQALVKHMVHQADSQGVASCLETAKDSNIPFYKKLGYEVKSKVLIPSPYGDFALWCLYREPPAA